MQPLSLDTESPYVRISVDMSCVLIFVVSISSLSTASYTKFIIDMVVIVNCN